MFWFFRGGAEIVVFNFLLHPDSHGAKEWKTLSTF